MNCARCHRQRYRLLDLDRLCWRLGVADPEQVRKNLEASLAERIARGQLRREPRWTESLAVGSLEFVRRFQPLITVRLETKITGTADNLWTLQEAALPYGQEMASKIVRKAFLER